MWHTRRQETKKIKLLHISTPLATENFPVPIISYEGWTHSRFERFSQSPSLHITNNIFDKFKLWSSLSSSLLEYYVLFTGKILEGALITYFCLPHKIKWRFHPVICREDLLGRIEVQLYSFSWTLALDGCWWSTPRPGHLHSRERPGTHCTGGWVGIWGGLDRSGKSGLLRDSIRGTFSQ